jgi:hypothetical protein
VEKRGQVRAGRVWRKVRSHLESKEPQPVGVLGALRNQTKWNPATAPRAPRHSGRSGRPKYIEMGHDERMEGSPSKLIFFLTILDSHALNGPVATHVQLVNRMLAECLRSASGSNRSAAAASRTNARCRGGEPCSEDLSVTVRERESQRQKGRTGSRDAHRPPYFE